MSNVSKEIKATVIVTRDEMAYMVQRVVANMEEKMLSQIFYDKALEGVKKEVGNVDENGIVGTNRFISVPITVAVEKAESESDITSVLASRIYDSITLRIQPMRHPNRPHLKKPLRHHSARHLGVLHRHCYC